MGNSASHPGPEPERAEAIPKSYAVYVTEQRIAVWQYRVDIGAPGGTWRFVETLTREDDPRLSLDHAMLHPPGADGYWIYSKSYDCQLECA